MVANARDEVLDYLHNYYDISKDTLIITNSDMGHGYTPYVFVEIEKAFRCKHEYFWDRYHLNLLISDMKKNFSSVLEEKLFSAIEKYSKKVLGLSLIPLKAILEKVTWILRRNLKKSRINF